jgi:hypothetical protein
MNIRKRVAEPEASCIHVSKKAIQILLLCPMSCYNVTGGGHHMQWKEKRANTWISWTRNQNLWCLHILWVAVCSLLLTIPRRGKHISSNNKVIIVVSLVTVIKASRAVTNSSKIGARPKQNDDLSCCSWYSSSVSQLLHHSP